MLLSFVVLFLVISSALALVSIDPWILKDLEKDGEARIMIRMKKEVDLKQVVSKANGDHHLKGRLVYEHLTAAAERSQKKIINFLTHHNVAFRSYWIVNAITLRVKDFDFLKKIAEQEGVMEIVNNRPFKVDLEQPDAIQMPPKNESMLAEWNIEWVHAPVAWSQGNTGQAGVVMNADTGVMWNHAEIINSYRGSAGSHDFHWWDGIKENNIPGNGPCGVNSQVPCDDNGHGTHTTGTAAGTLSVGVAPGAHWVGCRNMDRGYGTPESYISCLQWAIAPTDLDGNFANPDIRPHAIGNSYGCTSGEGCVYDSLHDACEAVRAAGIFMAVSSGNSGSGCSSVNDPPGLEPSVISVGATGTNTNTIASYSSRGPVTVWGASLLKPELVAPGSGVRSCVNGGGYASYSGTSMASPHINGAVAILVTACPNLAYDVDGLQEVFEESALRLDTNSCGGGYPNNVYGYGQLQLDVAVATCQQKMTKQQ